MTAHTIDGRSAEVLQERAAGWLASQGIQAGARIGVMITEQSPEWICLIGGAVRSGVVPVMVNPNLLPSERAALLEDADVVATVASDRELRSACAGPRRQIPQWPVTRPMHYTSGTTGRPKGVWTGVLSPEDGERLWREEVIEWGLGPEDHHLVVAPLYHSAPLRLALTSLLVGGSVTVMPKFDATSFRLSDTKTPTTTFMAPAHLQRLQTTNRLHALGPLRLLLHAGAPCPVPLKESVIGATAEGAVWEFYGSTEGQFTVCSAADWRRKPGTVGRPRQNRTLEVRDGTVWCRPPEHARWEYWRDEGKTARAWQDDWFTVGDLGRLDDDGYLYLEGRRDDLIVSGGVNIYPAEIEQAIREAPEVDDVVVVGVDDEQWGQRVIAIVATRAGRRTIEEHVRTHLAPFKQPKEIVIVDTIPREGLGKVPRRAIASLVGVLPPGDVTGNVDSTHGPV